MLTNDGEGPVNETEDEIMVSGLRVTNSGVDGWERVSRLMFQDPGWRMR